MNFKTHSTGSYTSLLASSVFSLKFIEIMLKHLDYKKISNDTNMRVRTNLSEAYRVTVVVIFKSILTGSKAFDEIVN
jgi:hypothetical protein